MRLDMLFTIVTRLAVMVMGLVTSILTARFLGVEGRGMYFFVITGAGLVAQFANLGVHASNTYYVAKDHSMVRGLAANSVWIATVVGGGISLLGFAIVIMAGWYTEVPVEYMLLGVVIGPLNLLFMLASNLLVGVNRIRTYNYLEMFRNFAALAGIGLALLWGLGVGGVLAGSMLAILVAVLAVLIALFTNGQLSFRPDAGLFRTGFRYALKSYVIATAGFLVLRGNVFLLQESAGATETGYYSIAAQIADVLVIIPASVGLVLFPRLARDPFQRFELTLRYLGVVSGIILAFIVAILLVLEPVIGFVFGTDFLPAAPVLRWMLPGVFFLSVVTVLSQYLSACGIPWQQIGAWIIAFLFMAVFSVLLIPDYGALGAAAAFSVSHFVLMALLLLVSIRVWRESQSQPESPADSDKNSEEADRP